MPAADNGNFSNKRKDKRKRANGQGGVSFYKGLWVARWSVYAKDGQRKRKSISARTEEEAYAKLERILSGWSREDLAMEDEDGPRHHVYFIQALTGGPIKIGTTNNIKKRFTVIQNNSPVPLKVLHLIPEGGHRVETKLHRRFAAFRLHGEWFDASRELLEYVYRLKDGKVEEAV